MSALSAREVRSVVDVLYDEIHDEILSGTIEPGTKLTEVMVATRYSVARPSARAVIERLVGVGLLQRILNRAPQVPLLQSGDIRDLYIGRRAIEREVVAQLAREGRVPPETRRMIAELRIASAYDALPESVASGVEFHRLLVNGLGSARMTRMYNSIIGEVQLAIAQVQGHRLLSPVDIADQHDEILDAIAARQVERAVAAISEHLDHAEASLHNDVESGEKPNGSEIVA